MKIIIIEADAEELRAGRTLGESIRAANGGKTDCEIGGKES
jgi:hypothetical protein